MNKKIILVMMILLVLPIVSAQDCGFFCKLFGGEDALVGEATGSAWTLRDGSEAIGNKAIKVDSRDWKIIQKSDRTRRLNAGSGIVKGVMSVDQGTVYWLDSSGIVVAYQDVGTDHTSAATKNFGPYTTIGATSTLPGPIKVAVTTINKEANKRVSSRGGPDKFPSITTPAPASGSTAPPSPPPAGPQVTIGSETELVSTWITQYSEPVTEASEALKTAEGNLLAAELDSSTTSEGLQAKRDAVTNAQGKLESAIDTAKTNMEKIESGQWIVADVEDSGDAKDTRLAREAATGLDHEERAKLAVYQQHDKTPEQLKALKDRAKTTQLAADTAKNNYLTAVALQDTGKDDLTPAQLDVLASVYGITTTAPTDETPEARTTRLNTHYNAVNTAHANIATRNTKLSTAQAKVKTAGGEAQEAAKVLRDAQNGMELAREAISVWHLEGFQGRDVGKIFGYVQQFVSASPKFPNINNAIFGNSDWYKSWRQDVDKAFATLYLDRQFTALVCDDKYDISPTEATDAVAIEVSPGHYQFVASIQAERSGTKVGDNKDQLYSCDMSSDPPLTCPNGWLCKDGLCFENDLSPEPKRGYLYKISWSVTAPSDVSMTLDADEGRDEIDFNLWLGNKKPSQGRVDGGQFLFKYPNTNRSSENTIHLGHGNSSRSLDLPPMIIDLSDTKYEWACIVFGRNKPRKIIPADEIYQVCTEIKQISRTGTVDFDGGPTGSGIASSPSRAGAYCGINGDRC